MQIVGPDDKLHTHSENEVVDDAGADVGSLTLMPPSVKVQSKWLVVTAHLAEYLPIMDEYV